MSSCPSSLKSSTAKPYIVPVEADNFLKKFHGIFWSLPVQDKFIDPWLIDLRQITDEPDLYQPTALAVGSQPIKCMESNRFNGLASAETVETVNGMGPILMKPTAKAMG